MLRLANDFVSDLGCWLAALVVPAWGFPSCSFDEGAGWKAWRPLGVSTVTLKWLVFGGPMFDGRSCGSTYTRF